MIGIRAGWPILAGTLLSMHAVVSCAEDPGSGAAPAPTPQDPIPPSNGDDAGTDAGPPDAAPSKCSADGWCHTIVPEATRPGIERKLALQDVWSTGSEAWAVAASGEILHFDGTEWTVETTAKASLYGIWGVATTDLWAVGADGLILHRALSNGPPTWEVVPSATTAKLFAIWGPSHDDLWIAAADGIYRSSGTFGAPSFSFENVVVPPSVRGDLSGFYRVWGTGTGDVGMFGPEPCEDPAVQNCVFEESRLIRYSKAADGGAQWSRAPLVRSPWNYPQIAGGAAAPGGGTVVIGNDVQGGTGCYVSDPITSDAGIAWDGTGPCSFARSVWMASASLGWAVGRSGLAQEWDGTSWHVARLTHTLVPVAVQLNAVKGGDTNGVADVWIIGSGVALRRQLP